MPTIRPSSDSTHSAKNSPKIASVLSPRVMLRKSALRISCALSLLSFVGLAFSFACCLHHRVAFVASRSAHIMLRRLLLLLLQCQVILDDFSNISLVDHVLVPKTCWQYIYVVSTSVPRFRCQLKPTSTPISRTICTLQ